MTRWFRVYDDLVDDFKAQSLDAALFKTWVNMLCLASRNDGWLPALDSMAFSLRMDREAAQAATNLLLERGLIDVLPEGLRPHNWDVRQYKSDRDPTAAERQRRRRANSKAEAINRDDIDHVTQESRVTSLPPESDTDTDTDSVSALVADTLPIQRAMKGSDTSEPEGFTQFWEVYPKREGNADRKGAVKAFGTALKRADVQTIIAGAEGYAAHCQEKGKIGTEFVKQAKAWLNGDLWIEWQSTKAITPAIVQHPVLVDSPEWTAWRKHKGKPWPETDLRANDGSIIGRGWYCASRWPPGHEGSSSTAHSPQIVHQNAPTA